MQVTRIQGSIVLFRGYPVTLRPDPAYLRALNQWASAHGVKLRLIQLSDQIPTGLLKA
jgi:putative transposase